MQRLLIKWQRACATGPAPLELFAAWMSFAYFLSFASGQMTLTRVSAMLAKVAPLWVWLLVFAALAIGQVAAMLRCDLRPRRAVAFAGLVVWSAITGALFITGLYLGYSVLASAVSVIQFVTPALASLIILASLQLMWQEGDCAA